MKNFCAKGGAMAPSGPTNWLLAGLLALMLGMIGVAAHAEGDDLSKESKACLSCHDKAGLVKTLESGEALSLSVSTQAYVESMHKKTDCEDCHSNLDSKTHGKDKALIKSLREFSVSMRESCRDCHKKKFTEYEDSVHAALIKEGSKKAPLCSSCHNPHTVQSWKITGPIADTPCAKCHQEIFKAYSKDVHGLERIAKGQSAPLCANCHQAHAVKAASMGDGIKDACLSCHKEAINQHKDWLPNTALHFEAISCPVCHAPDAQRRVNLRLYDGTAKRQVSEKTGVPKFEKRADTADAKDMGLDERALWSLLKEFNQDGGDGKMMLRGRLEVRSGIEAHQLSEKSRAIKDCDTCHKQGAAAFESVTLTIAGADGLPLHHGIQKDVLNSLTSMDSVRGFYAIGSTRIKLLDVLLVLVMLGALSVPIVHWSVRRLFKNFRDRLEAERAAAQRQADSQSSTDARRPDDSTPT